MIGFHHHTGKTTWRTPDGWNFWIRSPLSRISTLPIQSHNVFAVPFKSLLEKGKLKKPSSHSLLRDGSPVILWLSTIGRTEVG
ncbi:hypothetical protein BC827DRAFT_1183958 [Russula dissimulans]|nr:hypothetical protein BC827DRAFT_1183958 [Russula dissimulans]